MVRPTKEKAKLQHYLGEERRRYLESIRSDRRSCCANERQRRFMSWEAHADRLESGAD
jgi:hypothetical protein